MKLDPAQHEWMERPAVKILVQALAAGGAHSWAVGGVVRDSFLGRPVGDVDMAVDVPPEKTMELLERAGIKAVPTGIDFGTITAVVDGKGYEITSLRRDVTTDGRRAVVAYTDDRAQDAMRRDFTINALYVGPDGTMYDPLGGIEDIKARRLRFIGNAEDRIREDVLRILRYYRFLSQLDFPPDDGARAACRALAGLLPKLSAERLGQEVARLLMGQGAVAAARLMQKDGIWAAFLPMAKNVERLEKLIELEGANASALFARRLAALVDEDACPHAAHILRLPKETTGHLLACARTVPFMRVKMTDLAFRQVIYDVGADVALSALLIAAAEEGRGIPVLLPVLKAWESPVFPLTGKDLLARGFTEGPAMGGALKVAEQWWRDKDFKATKEECLEHLREVFGI